MTGPSDIVSGVHRIAVLRANAVGDFIFALPALHALRYAYPQAEISLLGKAWHADFLHDRPGPIDRVIPLPPVGGVTAPPQAGAHGEAACIRFLRAQRFDLAVQLHGGGRYSNPFVARLGARTSVGLRAPDAPALDRWLAYVPLHNERLRLLETVGLAGAHPVTLDPRLELTARDRAEAAAQVPENADRLVVLQPGATDPRRRWPAEGFAAVGDALHERGARVVVNGTAGERELVAGVVQAMRAPAVDLSGRLSLGGLAALLARARVVVANDTGPLYLAQAVGTATVGIYWLTNLLVSGPLVQARHRHVLSYRTRCPACGQENLSARCEHDPSFVDDVSPDEVIRLALELYGEKS